MSHRKSVRTDYTKKLKSIRNSLWKKSPRCRKCGKVTLLPKKPEDSEHDLCATIQHFYYKGDPRRGTGLDISSLTLWCHKCNDEDNQKHIELINILNKPLLLCPPEKHYKK